MLNKKKSDLENIEAYCNLMERFKPAEKDASEKYFRNFLIQLILRCSGISLTKAERMRQKQ